MFPNRFFAGLISFLIAHIWFLFAFTTPYGFSFSWWMLLPVILAASVVVAVLYPYLGRLKIPMVIYIILIATMAWQAWARWSIVKTPGALMAATGAIFFLVSDTTLAINKFKKEFKCAEIIILSTYYTSIWFFALSLEKFLD